MGPILAAFLAPIITQAGTQVANTIFPGAKQQGSGGGGLNDLFGSILDGLKKAKAQGDVPSTPGGPTTVPMAQPYRYPAWDASPQNPIYNAMSGWQGMA